jgi:hypothetical protein
MMEDSKDKEELDIPTNAGLLPTGQKWQMGVSEAPSRYTYQKRTERLWNDKDSQLEQ